MLIRRGFYRWQFAAAIVLPVWLLIGYAIFGSSGWGVIGLMFATPIAFITLGVVALLIAARPDVRRDRAVDWADVAVLGVWHLLIVGAGFYGDAGITFAILAMVGAIGAFWYAIWRLLSDGARRVRATMAEYERLAATGGAAPGSGIPGRAETRRPEDAGEVIVIREERSWEQRRD
ncbi:hypothetical protein BCL57_001983 [Agromyces flavus]|uniref:Uncharacterized protein n=1 Tax=Agromyces flavus TaxID=589382 RepID=A0A1H1Q2C6_9MICO|nr:hypothetical protein [Agromyces flavus]MCP2367824.1 hypothetical protein [Agromyces flavus]GGI47284.1 hypothetical protein GCM10010932_19720 [Agromyces flavus]SDS17129.1 hypothetical protein SAMN04489721_0882 [Agromyces flavus]